MADVKANKPQTESDRTRTAIDTRQNAEPRGLSRRESNWLAASPFDFFERVTEEMDRTFDRLFRDFGFGRSLASRSLHGQGLSREALWAPRVEAFQQGDRFVVRAELPGLKKDDVQVEVTEDAVTIQGERHVEQEEQRGGYRHSELSYGQFYRRIPLPDGVITESAKATFKDGVLEIGMQAPPAEANRGRRLEIAHS